MEEIYGVFSAVDPVILLGVTGGLAFLFIVVVVYDSIRRKRSRGWAGTHAHRNPLFRFISSPVKTLRPFYQTLEVELQRRRRRTDIRGHRRR